MDFVNPPQSAANQQPPEETGAVEERLALPRRLLDVSYGGSMGAVTLLAGQLPPNFPLELPLPPGAQVVGSCLRGGSADMIIIDAPQSVTEARAFYQERLPALGWSRDDMMFNHGGFNASGMSQMSRFVSPDQRKALTVNARERGAQGCSLSIGLHDESPDLRRQRRQRPRQLDALIPPLIAPEGAEQRGGGGGGATITGAPRPSSSPRLNSQRS